MKLGIFCLSCAVLLSTANVQAQYTASKDAVYLATIKAVADYKINDEETLSKMNKLRQDKAFLKKLQKMVDKLSNSHTKDATNRKVLKILEQAGEDIYNELN